MFLLQKMLRFENESFFHARNPICKINVSYGFCATVQIGYFMSQGNGLLLTGGLQLENTEAPWNTA